MTLMEEKTLADHDINVRSTRQELRLLEEQLKKHEVTDIHTGYVGVDDDYPVSVKQVLNITAELGALETQRRVRELPRYQVTADPDTVSRPQIHCKDCKHCYPPLTAVVDNEVKEVSDFRCSRMFGFTEADGWCYMFERKSSDG